jgi:succinyl-diaminopimelate desuccinylase
MDLAAHLTAGNAARDVTFVLYEGEEIADEHNGLRHLFETSPALVAGDLAVMLEPTDGWIEAGCQGTVHVRATFHGTRAHSARPWMGVNAIHRAAGLLGRIAESEPETVDVDGLIYREALQVVRVEGGVANNVVPDRCSIVVNRRFAPARSLDETIAEVRDLCAEADEVEIINASPAASPGLAHPLVAELVEGAGGRVRPKLGWTDVARFAAHGIPAANFGPGDPLLAHTGDERVSAESLDACASTLRALVGMK